MSIIGFIVVGDRTSHGGLVISGDITFTIDGQPVARVGDKVFCPRCKTMTTIATSRFPSIFDLGQTMAYHQDSTSCGALLYSRHNNHAGWDDGVPEGGEADSAAVSSSESQLDMKRQKNAPLRFREHFILHDDEGNVSANVPYSVTTGEGNTFEGESDAEGRTDVIWTDSPEAVDFTVLPKKNAAVDPYHFDEQEASGDYPA